MNPITSLKDKSTIQDEAADWIIRLDKDDLSVSEREAFHAWLQESTRHKIEFIELAKVWGNMDALALISEEIPAKAETFQTSYYQPRLQKGIPPYLAFATAAVFMTLCIVAILQIYNAPAQMRPVALQQYQTAIGEFRNISLSDGSLVNINTNSRIQIAFKQTERSIYLLQGEAHFTVAKDSQRPFVVYAGEGSITAIGTAFNVKLSEGMTDVIVAEGQVNVASVAKAATEKIRLVPGKPAQTIDTSTQTTSLSAGQKISFGQKKLSSIRDVQPTQLKQELSWQTGMLLFDETPLEQVVREVCRYTQTRIVIQDPQLASLPVAGYFKAGETAAMLEVLEISFGIKVTQLEPGYIVLSKNDSIINY